MLDVSLTEPSGWGTMQGRLIFDIVEALGVTNQDCCWWHVDLVFFPSERVYLQMSYLRQRIFPCVNDDTRRSVVDKRRSGVVTQLQVGHNWPAARTAETIIIARYGEGAAGGSFW